jgi:putative transposase
VRRTVPPSAEIEEQIDRLLAVGVGENPREALSELAKLGARLIIQRAVEDEFDAWLGRARYERRPEAPPGLRNGFRARRVQTAEGELEVEIPQVREAAEPFVSKLFPRGSKLLRTEPAQGDGDRRVRARPVDARRRVAVRAGRAREALEVDRITDLLRAARAL